jgi:hypothetical protein
MTSKRHYNEGLEMDGYTEKGKWQYRLHELFFSYLVGRSPTAGGGKKWEKYL